MKRRKLKIFLFVFAGILAAVGLSGFVYYRIFVHPFRVMMTDEFWERPADEQREHFHKILSLPKNAYFYHDACLELTFIGDESSVPFLVNNLKYHPRSEDWRPCSTTLCLNALKSITNNDPGMEYKHWKAWWKKNKDKSRRQWVLLGFEEMGLPATDPPDDKFKVALIRALVDERYHVSKNAWDLLSTVPEEKLKPSIEKCMVSGELPERRGAAVALQQLATPDAIAMLRKMTSDGNADIRETALARLNRVLRDKASKSADLQVIWHGKLAEDITAVGACGDPDRLILGAEVKMPMGRDSKLLGFDVKQKKVAWSLVCDGVINAAPVAREGKVYTVTDEGTVYCVGEKDGSLIWKHETEGQYKRPLNKLIVTDLAVMVPEETYLWALERQEGGELWKLDIKPVIGGVCFDSGFVFVITENKELMKISPEGEVAAKKDMERKAHSLSCSGDSVSILSRDTPVHLTAFDSSTLTLRWEKELGKSETYEKVRPAQDASVVIAGGGGHIAAFDAQSGKELWSVLDTTDSSVLLMDNHFLIANTRLRLELRGTQTGEVVAAYAEPAVHDRPLALSPAMIATADMDGSLWLLNIPETLKH